MCTYFCALISLISHISIDTHISYDKSHIVICLYGYMALRVANKGVYVDRHKNAAIW